MKSRAKKCEYGHIRAEKRHLLLCALIMVACGIAVFVLGLALNKFDKRNIFTVIAVLFVLPMARYLTTFIILIPYRTCDREYYERVRDVVPTNAVLFADYVFSSGERVMGLSFLVITEHELIGCLSNKKQKQAKIDAYLTDALRRRELPGKIVLVDSFDSYLQRLSKCEKVSEAPKEEVLEFLRSLSV